MPTPPPPAAHPRNGCAFQLSASVRLWQHRVFARAKSMKPRTGQLTVLHTTPVSLPTSGTAPPHQSPFDGVGQDLQPGRLLGRPRHNAREPSRRCCRGVPSPPRACELNRSSFEGSTPRTVLEVDEPVDAVSVTSFTWDLHSRPREACSLSRRGPRPNRPRVSRMYRCRDTP